MLAIGMAQLSQLSPASRECWSVLDPNQVPGYDEAGEAPSADLPGRFLYYLIEYQFFTGKRRYLTPGVMRLKMDATKNACVFYMRLSRRFELTKQPTICCPLSNDVSRFIRTQETSPRMFPSFYFPFSSSALHCCV